MAHIWFSFTTAGLPHQELAVVEFGVLGFRVC